MSSAYSFGVLGKLFSLFPGSNSEPAWLILGEEIDFFYCLKRKVKYGKKFTLK